MEIVLLVHFFNQRFNRYDLCKVDKKWDQSRYQPVFNQTWRPSSRRRFPTGVFLSESNALPTQIPPTFKGMPHALYQHLNSPLVVNGVLLPFSNTAYRSGWRFQRQVYCREFHAIHSQWATAEARLYSEGPVGLSC